MIRDRFIFFLLILVLSLVYTGWRFWQILPFGRPLKWGFAVLYFLSSATLFIHYGFEKQMPMGLATVTYELGTSWLIFFLYALLFFVVLDLLRLTHLIPGSFLKDSPAGSCVVLGGISLLLAGGYLHYHHKYREEIEIVSAKAPERPVTVVLASDLHAGYHNRRGELSRWVDMTNGEHPDLVLFAGDILDGSIRPAREWHYEEEFRRIEAPVYSCLGNHEYIGKLDYPLAFFEDAGIHLLRDASADAAGILIIGRDDLSNPGRTALPDLVPPQDSIFTILLDHQPYHLEEASDCRIDFQFSGHTHHGQIWPGNWVTDLLFEKAYGAYRKGDTRYYISSGLGIWGGKFRIGTRSEYIVLHIRR